MKVFKNDLEMKIRLPPIKKNFITIVAIIELSKENRPLKTSIAYIMNFYLKGEEQASSKTA
jgi:hypothetical protein